MIATFLALFAALACCQALLTVKLADRLSPEAATGGAGVPAARGRGTERLA